MLKKGDLIRVPANCYLSKRPSELHVVDKYLYLNKPEVGIFIRYQNNSKVLLFIKNNYWSADISDVNKCRSKNVS